MAREIKVRRVLKKWKRRIACIDRGCDVALSKQKERIHKIVCVWRSRAEASAECRSARLELSEREALLKIMRAKRVLLRWGNAQRHRTILKMRTTSALLQIGRTWRIAAARSCFKLWRFQFAKQECSKLLGAPFFNRRLADEAAASRKIRVVRALFHRWRDFKTVSQFYRAWYCCASDRVRRSKRKVELMRKRKAIRVWVNAYARNEVARRHRCAAMQRICAEVRLYGLEAQQERQMRDRATLHRLFNSWKMWPLQKMYASAVFYARSVMSKWFQKLRMIAAAKSAARLRSKLSYAKSHRAQTRKQISQPSRSAPAKAATKPKFKLSHQLAACCRDQLPPCCGRRSKSTTSWFQSLFAFGSDGSKFGTDRT